MTLAIQLLLVSLLLIPTMDSAKALQHRLRHNLQIHSRTGMSFRYRRRALGFGITLRSAKDGYLSLEATV